MSATKSKPAGRAVRVRQVAPMDKQICAWLEIPTKHLSKGQRSNFVVTGYTGSARRLKRLVEIAGMDENTMIRAVATAATIHREHAESILVSLGLIRAQCLSTAQGRKNNYTKTNKPRNT